MYLDLPILLIVVLLLLGSAESFVTPTSRSGQRRPHPFHATVVDDDNNDGSGHNNEEREYRAEELLRRELGASDAQMKKIVQRATVNQRAAVGGTMLTLPQNTLQRRLQFFRKEEPFGFSNAELRKIVAQQPTILALHTETMKSKVRNLCDVLGVESQKDRKRVLRKMVMTCPTLLTLSEQNAESKIQVLFLFFDGDKETLLKVVINAPHMLSHKTETLRSKIEWLLKFFDGDETIARRVTRLCPIILISSEERLEGMVQHFMKFSGGNRADCQKIVKRSPHVFRLSKDTIDSKIQNLRNFFENKDEEAVRRIVVACPRAVFGLTQDYLNVKLLFLVNDIFSGNVQATQRFVSKCPPVLQVRTETVKAKAEYIKVMVFKNNQNAFLAAISASPFVLTLSLENRIKPRIEAVLEAGLDPAEVNFGSMLMQTVDRFETWLENKRMNK